MTKNTIHYLIKEIPSKNDTNPKEKNDAFLNFPMYILYITKCTLSPTTKY